MSHPNILIVEDEAPIRDMLRFTLEGGGYEIEEAEDVKAAELAISNQIPDLILLDWMLPEVSGLDFAKRLKKDDSLRDIPIILLTAKSEEENLVRGLEAGADDYITKPFSTRELIARIKAVIRRTSGAQEDELVKIENLTIDLAGHRVLIGDDEIHLGPTEFKLLRFFATHPDRVYNRAQLLDHVWGGNVYVEERTVDVHIRRLRKGLAEQELDNLIQTVRGAGYRFSAKR